MKWKIGNNKDTKYVIFERIITLFGDLPHCLEERYTLECIRHTVLKIGLWYAFECICRTVDRMEARITKDSPSCAKAKIWTNVKLLLIQIRFV